MSRDAGPVKGGDSIIAFVDDPTGYKWEIIGSKGKPIAEPIAQVKGTLPCFDAAQHPAPIKDSEHRCRLSEDADHVICGYADHVMLTWQCPAGDAAGHRP